MSNTSTAPSSQCSSSTTASVFSRCGRNYRIAQVTLNLQDRLGLAKLRYERRQRESSKQTFGWDDKNHEAPQCDGKVLAVSANCSAQIVPSIAPNSTSIHSGFRSYDDPFAAPVPAEGKANKRPPKRPAVQTDNRNTRRRLRTTGASQSAPKINNHHGAHSNSIRNGRQVSGPIEDFSKVPRINRNSSACIPSTPMYRLPFSSPTDKRPLSSISPATNSASHQKPYGLFHHNPLTSELDSVILDGPCSPGLQHQPALTTTPSTFEGQMSSSSILDHSSPRTPTMKTSPFKRPLPDLDHSDGKSLDFYKNDDPEFLLGLPTSPPRMAMSQGVLGHSLSDPYIHGNTPSTPPSRHWDIDQSNYESYAFLGTPAIPTNGALPASPLNFSDYLNVSPSPIVDRKAKTTSINSNQCTPGTTKLARRLTFNEDNEQENLGFEVDYKKPLSMPPPLGSPLAARKQIPNCILNDNNAIFQKQTLCAIDENPFAR